MINSIKNIHIYDIEVFKEDWVVVLYDVDNDLKRVYSSDKDGTKILRNYIVANSPILCGFNNKHYDDYILLGILAGNTPQMIKAHNDFIINGGSPWEFEGIKGVYKKDWFRSFDLRDDLPIDLSLKAIEGNLGADIRESSIDFTIDRKLTIGKMQEVIDYCIADVKNTYELFKIRAGYLNGKLKVAKTGNLDPIEALGLTNPKLAATFLKAEKLANPNEGELIYNPPKELQLDKYKEVLDFYKIVDYEKTLTIQAKDLELVYGWGGIHGAIEHCQLETTDKFKIVDIDVGSYYPSMIIQLGYAPESIPSAKGYEDIYNQRITAKHSGDSDTADALKLVLNSTYGALKNQYNPLYEPRVANHICISGQLLLTDLIEKLEAIPTLKLIQANTDGLMIGYNPKHEKKVNEVVAEWENRTRLNMEYVEIKKIAAQKDVNNYVLVQGETYLIKDGVKTVTKKDKSNVVVKGSYVSLYKGGDFRNNSLVIVHKALVEYFLNGTPVEETVNNATNVLDFQMIAKTGRTYTGTVYEINGEFVPVQKVNRVYASLDPNKGTLYKVKDTGRKDKVANIPEHCLIDNTGKEVTLADIDKNYYIEVANKRIKDYLGQKEKKGRKSMATKKQQEAAEQVEHIKSVNDLNIYGKLALSKLEFGNSGIKPTGINRFAEFKYFELADIIPVANHILLENGLVFFVRYTNEEAIGTLVNCSNPTEQIIFTSPMRELNILSDSGKKKMNELQALGAEQTYQKRYLYNMLFDVVEADVFDATLGREETNEPVKVISPPATKEERAEMKKELAGNSPVTELQKNSIKSGLSKLRESDENHEVYISKIVNKMQNGCTSSEAEEIISEIAKKLYPEG